MTFYSPYQGSFFAHRITLEGLGDDAFAQSLSTARVDMNPHQVDAALFALASPLAKGVLLADEVGLFERRAALRREMEEMLDRVQESLQVQPTLATLFTVRWELG